LVFSLVGLTDLLTDWLTDCQSPCLQSVSVCVGEQANPDCSGALCCRAPSIPEAQDMSRSSSNASSFASVVEEVDGEPEVPEDYDTGLVRPGGGTDTQLFYA